MVRYRCPVPLFQSTEVLTAINMFLPKRKLAFSKTFFLDVSGDVKVARILWQLVLEGTENKIIFVQKDFAPCIGARYYMHRYRRITKQTNLSFYHCTRMNHGIHPYRIESKPSL